MAIDGGDPYAFIIDHSRYSSSQEDLLLRSKFAREDEAFPDTTAGEYPSGEYSGRCCRELDGGDYSGRTGGGDFVAGDGDCAETRKLGFGGERKGSFNLEGDGGVERGSASERRMIEQELKKGGILRGEKEGSSPLMHCSGKLVIESEVVVFEGDVKVEVVSPLRYAAPESVEGGVNGGGEGEDMRAENLARKKLEKIEVVEEGHDFVKEVGGGDTEVIGFEEEEHNVVKVKMVGGGESGDTEVIEVEEEVGSEKIDVGKRGFDKAGNIEMNEDVEEVENCVRVDEERSDIGREPKEVELQVEGIREGREVVNIGVVVTEYGDDGGECRNGKEINNVDGRREKDVLREEEVRNEERMADVGKEVFQGGEGEGNCLKNGKERSNFCGEDEIKMRGKRKLPQSISEQWGEEHRIVKGGLKGLSIEGSKTEKSKDGEATMKCILYALKLILGDKSHGHDDGNEADIYETAKSRGMTFPRPRFRS